MKCPFKFTSDYIADLEQVLNAKLIRDKTTIVLSYINGDSDIINFDDNAQCIEDFKLFCETCTTYSKQRQVKERLNNEEY